MTSGGSSKIQMISLRLSPRSPFGEWFQGVKAIVVDGLALHPCYAVPSQGLPSGYILTHLHSGRRVAFFRGRLIAVQAFKALAGLKFFNKLNCEMSSKDLIQAKDIIDSFLLNDELTEEDYEELGV